eukprot:14380512-Ditylum_brightwellii.AAC.1
MCLGNLAANESNHSPLLRQGAFKTLVDQAKHSNGDIKQYCAFAIANLASNSDVLNRLGKDGGINPLLSLAKMNNVHSQCLAITSLRRLALIPENRERLISS